MLRAFLLSTCFAAPLAAQDITATMRFDSTTGNTTLRLAPAPEGALQAEWLAAQKETAPGHYSGTLPALGKQLGRSAWTDKASYITGGRWLPGDLTVARSHDITVITPEDYRVAVTGRIISEELQDGQRHTRFTFEGPSNMIGLFIGAYTYAEQKDGPLTLRTYLNPQNAELSARYLAASSRYIEGFEALIGPYPYESFSVAAANIPVGLGFAGLTYVGKNILPHSYMSGRSLAHEILHSWWGNAVRVDYASGNWSEGLTTYMADYGVTESEGAEAALTMRLDWIRQLDAIPESARKPLRAFRSASHEERQSEGYGKAAYVFHMLRQRLGDEAFYAALRLFYQEMNGKRAGWKDLERAFSQASGADLSRFFSEWLDRPTLPRLALEEATPLEGGGLRLTLSQSAPAYELVIPVLIETASGTTRAQVTLDTLRQSYTLPLAEAALSVSVDPSFHLARRPAPQELSPVLQTAFETPVFEMTALGLFDDEAQDMLAQLMPQRSFFVPAKGSPLPRVVLGETAAVAAYHQEHIGTAPAYRSAGTARAWVAYGPAGRLWFFMSADDPATLPAQLAYLSYYSGKTHAAFENGGSAGSGTAPPNFAALSRKF